MTSPRARLLSVTAFLRWTLLLAITGFAWGDSRVESAERVLVTRFGRVTGDTVRGALSSDDPHIRSKAAEVAGFFSEREIVTALIARCDEEDPQVRRSAFRGLLEAFRRHFVDVSEIPSIEQWVRQDALNKRIALAWLGAPNPSRELLSQIEDPRTAPLDRLRCLEILLDCPPGLDLSRALLLAINDSSSMIRSYAYGEVWRIPVVLTLRALRERVGAEDASLIPRVNSALLSLTGYSRIDVHRTIICDRESEEARKEWAGTLKGLGDAELDECLSGAAPRLMERLAAAEEDSAVVTGLVGWALQRIESAGGPGSLEICTALVSRMERSCGLEDYCAWGLRYLTGKYVPWGPDLPQDQQMTMVKEWRDVVQSLPR